MDARSWLLLPRDPKAPRTPPRIPGPQESVWTAGVLRGGPGCRLPSVGDAASADGRRPAEGRLTEGRLTEAHRGSLAGQRVPGASPRPAGGWPPGLAAAPPTATRERGRGPGAAGLRIRQPRHAPRRATRWSRCGAHSQGRESGCRRGSIGEPGRGLLTHPRGFPARDPKRKTASGGLGGVPGPSPAGRSPCRG